VLAEARTPLGHIRAGLPPPPEPDPDSCSPAELTGRWWRQYARELARLERAQEEQLEPGDRARLVTLRTLFAGRTAAKGDGGPWDFEPDLVESTGDALVDRGEEQIARGEEPDLDEEG